MKRGALDLDQDQDPKSKVPKTTLVTPVTPVKPGPTGCPGMTSSDDESNTDPDKDKSMDTGDPDSETQYNVPTTNRFQILRIPIPDPKVYNVKKSPEVERPPEIVIPFAPMTKVRPLIPSNHHYGIKNLSDGIHLYCNTIKQHKEIIDIFDKANVYIFTHPYKSDKSKRFVLYGLNTYSEDLIIKDLEEYGIKPTKVTNMTVKKERYIDHATYLVYYPMDSQITLDIVKKAFVIRNTIVHWKHYASNGDGITTCSNCSQLGHSGYCTLPPKCGICSGAHVMSNCEHLLNKRAYKRESIAIHLLKCPNCDGQHTVGYQQCEKRIKYKENLAKLAQRQQQRYSAAPMPNTNPWAPLHQSTGSPTITSLVIVNKTDSQLSITRITIPIQCPVIAIVITIIKPTTIVIILNTTTITIIKTITT